MTAIGIVGPGRAGLGLALALTQAGHGVRLHGRRGKDVPPPLSLSWGGVPPWLSEVSVVVLAVRDDAIGGTAEQLARGGAVTAAHVVLHLSGMLETAPLGVLRPLVSRLFFPMLWTAGATRTVLSNGLTVLVQPLPDAPAAAIVTRVRAGFFDEPDHWAGISHVLEHMFFKGTPTRGVGEIARATKAAGGYLNAATSYDYTTYYAVLPSRGLPAAMTIQSDALRNAAIDADELRREIQVIIEEAKRKQDTPSAVAQETLPALLYDHHRIRRWRIGTEPVLRSFRSVFTGGIWELATKNTSRNGITMLRLTIPSRRSHVTTCIQSKRTQQNEQIAVWKFGN